MYRDRLRVCLISVIGTDCNHKSHLLVWIFMLSDTIFSWFSAQNGLNYSLNCVVLCWIKTKFLKSMIYGKQTFKLLQLVIITWGQLHVDRMER